jgi:phosphoglycolate phosphatase-like HAD superfamily hydrolase
MRAAPPVELRSIIGRTRHLLLDFDGPICNLFAGLPALSVAARLQQLLRSDGTPLPDHVASEDDPIEVLRFTSSLDLNTAALVETALHDAERAATATATPTPYVRDVLLACHQTGRRVAVISNNAQAAVATYLQAHHLAEHIDVIVGRTDPDPRLLKPHPTLSYARSTRSTATRPPAPSSATPPPTSRAPRPPAPTASATPTSRARPIASRTQVPTPW